MSCATMRPSASRSSTVSISPTALTRLAMIATASSTDISGPPKAKQSSDSCAIRVARSLSVPRQHVFDTHRRRTHHSGDRGDVIEMRDRQGGLDIGVAGNAEDSGVGGEQQVLAVGRAMHLDLAMRF